MYSDKLMKSILPSHFSWMQVIIGKYRTYRYRKSYRYINNIDILRYNYINVISIFDIYQ